MAKRGPPALKLPTACKPAKAKTTDSLQPAPQSQLEPKAPLLPDQAPPVPQIPSAPAHLMHIPDPVQPQAPPAHIPDPIQPQDHPVHVPNPQQPPAPPVYVINQIPQLNRSYFKPEFSGKPGEDVEAHLLRTNDWMKTHKFPRVAKLQRFCLTLTSETRL